MAREETAPSQEAWQYHLPRFLDRLAAEDELDLRDQAPAPFAGFLYHHRGARIPAHEAHLQWTSEGFRLALEAIDGSRWRFTFDQEADWDAFLVKMPGDEPALAWMSQAEFAAEEGEDHADKAAAIARGRFSFGLYFESQRTWRQLVEGLGDKRHSLLFLRPSGRTYVPPDGFDLDHEIVPDEIRPGSKQAPAHLGIADVRHEPARAEEEA